MKTLAITIHEHGGPEVLRAEETELSPPGDGEVLVRHEFIGVNFVDTYLRSGLYPAERLPVVVGTEAVGIVEDARGDAQLPAGVRVAYVDPLGAYCERRWMPGERLVRVPDAVSPRDAAAVLLKGLTARYLAERSYPAGPGDTVLVHAAAGGVGRLLCAWLRHRGARIVGTVGAAAKEVTARAAGCDVVLRSDDEDIVARVAEITHGRGVSAVYDGVGRATFDRSLECLADFGTLVSFGNASGPVPPVDPLRLAAKSAFLTRPSLKTHTRRPPALRRGAAQVFDLVERGVLVPMVHDVLPLQEASTAHARLHARETAGALLLQP